MKRSKSNIHFVHFERLKRVRNFCTFISLLQIYRILRRYKAHYFVYHIFWPLKKYSWSWKFEKFKKKHDDIESAFISNNNQKTNFAICNHLLICATFIIDYYVSKKKFNYLVSAGRNQTSCWLSASKLFRPTDFSHRWEMQLNQP